MRLFLLVPILLLIAACATSRPAAPPESATYLCEELQVEVRTGAETAEVELFGSTLTLPRVRSASGARYEDERALFWSKGDEARFRLGNAIHDGCRQVDELLFRGFGQEPGWRISVYRHGDRYALAYLGDYGTTERTFLDARRDSSPAALTYRAHRGTHRIDLRILDQPCTDTMSGEAYPRTVELQVDGRRLRGCGRP